MRPHWFERLGTRLGLALAGVILGLAVVTLALTGLAFDRATESVHEASAEAFEGLARQMLYEITAREAKVIAAPLDAAAAASRVAAARISAALDRLEHEGYVFGSKGAGSWLNSRPTSPSTVYLPTQSIGRPGVLETVAASAAADDVFPTLLKDVGEGVAIYYVSEHGAIRYHPPIDLRNKLGVEYDPRQQPFFVLGTVEANPERETRWTAPYADDAGNGLLVTVVTPVDARGAFRGVVGIDVSLDGLAARLEALVPISDSFAFLIDPEGRLIAASRGATKRLGFSDELTFGTIMDTPETAGLVAELRAGGTGLATLMTGDEPLLLAFAPLADPGWSLVIGGPARTVDRYAVAVASGISNQARLVRRDGIVAGIGAFLLALAVLEIGARRWVGRPIEDLVTATRRLSAGELGVTAPAGPPGDFRELSSAFDHMSRTLGEQRAALLESRRELEASVAERTRELGHLLAISADLGAADGMPALLQSVMSRLRGVVPFETGSVWLVDGDRLRRVALIEGVGSSTGPVDCIHGSTRESLVDRLPRYDPIRISDLSPDDPLAVLVGHGVRDLLLVPLSRRAGLSGVLVLADPVVDQPHKIALAGAVGRQLGTAVENTRLLLEVRERSALEERHHLARELHDSVSQALFGISLGLETARKQHTDPERSREAIDYAAELAEGAYKELRALIFELRPESLETEGLTGLLRRQAEMLRSRHGLHVDLDMDEPPISSAAKAGMYRVAQEALNNVVQHAAAANIRLSLACVDGTVRLEVRDDGRGFDPGSEHRDAFGLRSMRERIELLGGRWRVWSRSGAGTRVSAEVPTTSASMDA